MKKTHILLIGIILLASLLRLYKLDTVPPGVNRDEASIGVTANSLMTTGRDEYGKVLPLSFESFGDWKMPLYIYLVIPFVKVFGMSELAVRLPSALAGIVSVAALYYLTYILFASESLALTSALVLALMPWHIHISRVESEAIVATLALIVGSSMFFIALKKKSTTILIISALLFASTYYTYHGNHVSTSLLLVGLAFLYWKDIQKIPHWWRAVCIGGLIAGFILVIGFSADHTKLSGISIFGDPTIVHTKIELPRLAYHNPNTLGAKLLHNRITYAITTIVQNYLKSYGPDFLFIKGGGNSAHNIQGYGNLHLLEAPFLLLGVAWLLRFFSKKESKYILWWIAIGAVAAAITKDAPHSNRMLAAVPALAVAIAAGISAIVQYVPNKYRKSILILITAGYIISMGMYLDQYFVHFPKTESQNWGYAYKKLTPIIGTPALLNKKIIMTHPETSPYIYLMFYSGYSPADYQKQAKRYPISRDGFTDVAGFGRFSFRPIHWDTDLNTKDTVIIAKPEEVPDDYKKYIFAKIVLPDGVDMFFLLNADPANL